MTLAVKPRVLLAGDKSFISLLKYIVENEGFSSLLTDDLGEVMSLAEAEQPDLIALDDVWPYGSAAATRDRIGSNARTRHIPVLILAAGALVGASAGPDHDEADYILKPFAPDEFTSRLRSLLRSAASATDANVLRFADIVMELDAHRVYRNQRSVHLGPVEYRILQQLLRNPRKVLSRDEILLVVKGQPLDAATRAVDVHVSRIRKALCENGEVDLIRTVRGVGYSLDADGLGPSSELGRKVARGFA
jgi:two-component system phosphate regulon response regulator PhoB